MITTKVKQSLGFSLIELSIALVIVGLLIGSMISGFTTYHENALMQESRDDLKIIHEALIGFAIQHPQGRLPCPDTDVPGSANSGRENIGAGGDCSQSIGFLPYIDLGVNSATADPWGNPYAYAVDTDFTDGTSACPSVNPGGAIFGTCDPGTLTIHNIGGIAPGACNAASNCRVVSENIAAVFYSAGANGFATPAGLSIHELENLWTLNGLGAGPASDPNDQVFTSRAYANAGPIQFDDQIMWISSRILINRMIQAGRLP